METKISILNQDNEKLVGLKTTPLITKEKYPTVVLVHGFGVDKEDYGLFNILTKELVENNFLVYRFDFSGCGESDGDFSETTLTKLKLDLSNILQFVITQSEVDVFKLGILGQSFGTSIITSLQPKVKSVVFLGSLLEPKKILVSLFGDSYKPEGISERLRSDGSITKIKPQFWIDLDQYNLMEDVKKISCPILFVHGSADNKIPMTEMQKYFDSANEPKEKVIIKGADHGMLPCREEMSKVVVEWFDKTLK